MVSDMLITPFNRAKFSTLSVEGFIAFCFDKPLVQLGLLEQFFL